MRPNLFAPTGRNGWSRSRGPKTQGGTISFSTSADTRTGTGVSQGLVIRGGASTRSCERSRQCRRKDGRRTSSMSIYGGRRDSVRAAAKREGVALDERFFYSLEDPRCEAKIFEELRAHNDRILRERKAG